MRKRCQLDLAALIAQPADVAARLIQLADLGRKRLSKAADLGGELGAAQRDLTQRAAAEHQLALGRIFPVDQEHIDAGAIEQPAPKVVLGDAVVFEDRLDLKAVDGKILRRFDGRG
ncbi:MAG: hypothetical protein WAS73_04420, partial [Defluviicoccus sp.]